MQTTIKCACTSGIGEMSKTVVAKKDVWNCRDLRCHQNTISGQAEENRFTISASAFKAILQKINQEQHKNSGVNRKKARVNQDVQKQWIREVKIPHTGLVSLSEQLEQPCLNLIEVRTSNSFSILCRTTEPFNIPLNFSAKKQFLFDAFKPHKRRTITGDSGRFVSQQTVASWPGNVNLHPTGQWIVDAIEGKEKVRNLLRNHIISMVSEIRSGRMRPVDAFDGRNCSGLTRSPPALKLSPSKSIVQKRCGSDVPDSILASCSSTKSTSSCQSSSSSSCGVPLKGVLHCMWKSGLPHFEFSVDDRCDVYVANPVRVKSLSRSANDKLPDYVYLFHSSTVGTKPNVYSGNDLSETVAKMKVSSCLTLDSDNQKHLETEYVLFGSNEYNPGEMQSSTTAHRKHKGLQKRVVDVFRANNTSKYKSRPKFKDISEESKPDTFHKLDDLSKNSFYDIELLPCHELAAIVVKASVHNTSQMESNEGWGLKFLKNATAASSNNDCLRSGSNSDIKVLIPAAPHGGPRTRNGGPSSITERWRSGGHCDCGGWDVGCPLTILHHSSNNPSSVPHTDEDCKSFDLFIEGSKDVGPALKIVNVREGLDFVYFQPTLSSLESFSVAVALIHSRNPALSLEVCKA